MNKEVLLARAVHVGVVLVVKSGYKVTKKYVVEERRKLKSIKLWKQEGLACVEASRKHLVGLVLDPRTTTKEFNEALETEMAFLDIVKNQPKY